ncbi:MAG TPA: FHA domain-containing protein [Anaerolineae bacterium]|nr:FHA domain-containing protein [Anaerolineae bacterium]
MNLKLQTSAGVEYPLTTPSVTVGRENCDILLLQDTLVSRNHARFQVQGEVVTVTDLGSTNGTYINQVRLQPHIPQAIRVGDTVHIGNTTFTLRSDGGAGPTRAIGDMPAWQAPPARVPASWASDAMQARPAWIPPTPAAGSAPYPSPAPAYSYPTKSKSTGMLLEIGIGLFALMGFGWIYAGQTSTGVVLVIVNILLNLGYWFVATLTAGFSLLCTVPLQIAAVVISASKLNSYMSKNPDKFH